jgi:alcohol dehydrogenase class IV
MWQFSAPDVVFGEDALSQLAELESQRPFIVTDANMVKLGFTERVSAVMAVQECGLFAEVEPDPSMQTVQRCAAAMREHEPDLVIALGGGSCLDAAKTAWFLYERPDLDLSEINPFERFEMPGKARLIAIPTTSGTGADATLGVVLTDSDAARKIVVYARELQPSLTILDPSLTIGLPPQITADTGMDVLSHALEAFASPWHNDFADALALQAVKLVFAHLPQAYRDGRDLDARDHMHNAATLGGMAISNASVGLAHALAHAVGALFHKPHGRVVGLFLPYTIEYAANGEGGRYAEIARALQLPADDEAAGAASLAAALRQLAAGIDQPATLADLGIAADEFAAQLPELLAHALEDTSLMTAPRVPDEEEMTRLFQYAFDGRTIDF